MIRSRRRLRICTVLLICNLAFIWGNSLLPGPVSGAFSDAVKDLLQEVLPAGESLSGSGGLLRKLAHFTEFTLLGMCLTWLLGMLEKPGCWPLFLGIAAACVDETIQIFVPDRGPSVRDVALDSSGVLTGMILLHLGHTYYKRRKQRNTSWRKDQ